MLCNVPNHSKHSKTTKVIKLRWIAWIWCQKRSNNAKLRTKPVIKLRWSAWIRRTKRNQIAMNWIDLTSQTIQNNANLQRLSKYNELHRFDVKTNKNDELRRKPFKTTQIYKSYSNYDELHRFDVKTTKYVELRPKPFQTQQNYKSDQITRKCMDLTSKR